MIVNNEVTTMKKTLLALAFGAVAAVSLAQTTPLNGAPQTAPLAPTRTPQATSPNAPAPALNYRVEDISAKFNLSTEDAAAAIALSKALKTDPATIVADKGLINATLYQLGPAFQLQQATGKSITDLYNMYSGGQTWMQIASANNVPAAAYNPTGVDTTNWTNDDFTSGVWQSILMTNYGLSNDDMVFLSSGLHEAMPEVVTGAVVAREDNTPIRDVMNAYNQHSDWTAIEQQYALNVHNPPNQSQLTTAAPSTPPAPENTEAQNSTAVAGTTVTTPPAGTTSEANPPPTTTVTATTTQNLTTGPSQTTSEDTPSAIEEWQIHGGDINPYNGWAETTTMNTYALHTKHHYRKRHGYHRKVHRKMVHHKMSH